MSIGRMGARAAFAAVGVLVAMAFGAVSASAETVQFKYTGAEQAFVVPAGVTTVEVMATGGAGGTGRTEISSLSPGGGGGLGAVVSGSLTNLKGGQTLYVEVGGNGENEGEGGFNGGGNVSGNAGGGGGGASDVRTVPRATSGTRESRLIVAAGGGGGGEGTCEEAGTGGRGGDAEEAGTGGTGCDIIFGGGGGGPAGISPNGQGAEGGLFGSGGGGGGGLYGGGGGGASYNNGGGGGGSNLVPTAGTANTATAGAEPKVTITYTVAEECSMASGHGSVGKQGEAGHLSVIDSLSKNLAEPQKLQVNVERNSPRYHLVSLQQASCTGAAGERVFHGMGTAVRNSKKGYTLSFSIKEEAGGFFFESKVMKGAEEIKVNGGPLKTKTQEIS